MPAFAIFPPAGAGDFDLGCVHGYDFNAEPMQKEIKFTASDYAAASFEHNGGFQDIRGRHQSRTILLNKIEEPLPLRFGKEYGQ